MTALTEISAILFDLDGTLTDYEAGSEAGLRAALEVFNAQEKRPLAWDIFREAYDAVIEAESSWSSRQGFKMPARENRMRRFRILFDGLGMSPGSLLPDMADAYGLGRSTGTRLYPDVEPVLNSLHLKFKLGVLSEGSSQTQIAQMDAHKIKRYFSTVIISDQTPWHKPDESIYRFAALKMEIEPENIVMVGDRFDWDIRPAKAIGMKTVFLDRSELAETKEDVHLHADKVIHRLQELLGVL